MRRVNPMSMTKALLLALLVAPACGPTATGSGGDDDDTTDDGGGPGTPDARRRIFRR